MAKHQRGRHRAPAKSATGLTTPCCLSQKLRLSVGHHVLSHLYFYLPQSRETPLVIDQTRAEKNGSCDFSLIPHSFKTLEGVKTPVPKTLRALRSLMPQCLCTCCSLCLGHPHFSSCPTRGCFFTSLSRPLCDADSQADRRHAAWNHLCTLVCTTGKELPVLSTLTSNTQN